MFVSSAAPEDILRWFHHGQHDQRVLCLILASASDDSDHLSSLIKNFNDTDAALGQEVALIIFHPNANKTFELPARAGAQLLMNGVKAAFGISPLRDTPLFREVSDDAQHAQIEFSREASRATKKLDLEFMRLFEVLPDQLPAICTMVRGLEKVVIKPLGRDWNSKDILEQYFGKLHSFIVKLKKIRFPQRRNNIEKLIVDLENKTSSSEAIKKDIDLCLTALSKGLSISHAESQTLFHYLKQHDRSLNGLEQLINSISSFQFTSQSKKQRIEKCFRLAEKWDLIRDELNSYNIDEFALTELERAQYFQLVQIEILDFVTSLSESKLVNGNVFTKFTPERIWEAVARANNVTGILADGWELTKNLLLPRT